MYKIKIIKLTNQSFKKNSNVVSFTCLESFFLQFFFHKALKINKDYHIVLNVHDVPIISLNE